MPSSRIWPLSDFLVVQEHLLVHRMVELSLAGVDADLPEQRFHAERAGLVGDDRDDLLAQLGMAQQQRQHADERHRGGYFAALRAGERFGEVIERRRLDADRALGSLGQVPAQLPAALLKIADLRAVLGRAVEGDGMDALLGDGDLEAPAEVLHFLLVQFLLLVGDVAALARLAQAVALDGLGQDDGGRAGVLAGPLVGVVDLLGVVAAAAQLEQLLVAQIRHQLQQFGVLAEEILADVGAVPRRVGLVVAVQALVHALHQQAGLVALQQRVPVAPPDHLDHVPARPREHRLQFLDDLAVAAHRAVQPLEVAVDHEDQVVQLLVGRDAQGAGGFRLVRLAVAQESPDLARRRRRAARGSPDSA